MFAPTVIPASRPLLPTFDELEPYLRELDQRRWYSNYGELVQRFERELDGHFGVKSGASVATGSGFMSIAAAILSVAGRATPETPYALCPAHTFTATASATQIAGYTPHFVDCDPTSWAVEPEGLASHPMLARCGVVVVVAPYGQPFDMPAWEDFHTRTGIPVVIDAAAAADTLDRTHFSDRIPVCLSFHATKILGCGEAGGIIIEDLDRAWHCRQIINNGKVGTPSIETVNLNGKMSEYAAAVALVQMTKKHEVFEGFRRVQTTYDRVLGAMESAELVCPPNQVSAAYRLLDCRGAGGAAAVSGRLAEQGIETRLWYGPGLHLEPAYTYLPKDRLPVTENIASRLLGLPVYRDMTLPEIERVAAALGAVLVTA